MTYIISTDDKLKFNDLKEKDYMKSIINEKSLKVTFEDYFKCKLNFTDRYDLFDYISDDKQIYIELKERTCSSTKYDTLMMGMNKINKSIELIANNKKVYYVFKFTDCIMYYDFTEFNKKWVKDGGRTDRIISEFKKNGYYYIPSNLLKLL